MSSLISIIVPAFNEEKNILRCLNSISEQTYKNIEIICVDNASTDSTFEIIKNFSEKDIRIKAFHIEKKGVSNARNFGIKKASGNYIGFVDADDFIQPQMYEFLLKAAEENNCDFSCCKYIKTDKFSKKYFDYSIKNFVPSEFIDILNSDFVLNNELIISSACTKLIKKDILTEFENFKIGEDTVFCSELFKKTKNYILVDLPLFCYYNNIDSVSYSNLKSEKWFDLLKTRFISYENFCFCDKKTAEFYLDRGMKFILSYRFNLNNKKYKNEFKKYYKKYIGKYMKCESIPLKYKLSVILFYHFPYFYKMYRKSLDSTL